MRILVTGNHGLIGSKICEKLKLLHEVVGVDKDNFVECLYNFYGEPFDLIIHCGANCIIRNIIKNPSLVMENIDSTFLVMEFARRTGCKKVILFSSSRVEHKEENPYTTGKKFVENIAEAYKQCYGIDYLIIRPETVWGPNDNLKRVIPKWIKAALNNEKIIVYGNKYKTLPPIHVDDFTDYFMVYFNTFNNFKNKIIKITGKELLVTKIIDLIKKYTSSKSKVVFKNVELSQPQRQSSTNADVLCISNNFENRLKEVLK